uniref:peroxidase 29-like n=1 Tax=Fragaria vesca subsp. vesca TaxID=101020 RepID=UPI0005CB2F98|nr:PREDICTED: peroxidase 29-like [Fragaria vesca subsp. vesca]
MIVKELMKPIILTDPTTSAALLRLAFHDCQVDGCDASVLLREADGSSSMETESDKNFGIRKLETIDMIKTSLEQHCPQTVSCADIIQLAAREAIYLIFRQKNISLEQGVARAHTLGITHCRNINERLRPASDPTLSLTYSLPLQTICSNALLSDTTFSANDATPVTFDNHYFNDIENGRGLLKIDSEIARDPRTMPFVIQYGRDMKLFFDTFSSAFLKHSSLNVLVGEDGEVRRDCKYRNS